MENRQVADFDVLRAVACLGVVGIHALTLSLGTPSGTPNWMIDGMRALQMLLMFSTPTFVILSALLVGYAYDCPPRRFLQKRLRYIAVPFVSMCVAYATFEGLKGLARHGDIAVFGTEVIRESLRNLIGGNHLWFILPILQFYVLYTLCWPWLCRVRPAVVVGIALTLNAAYLEYFNFAGPPTNAYSVLVGRHYYSIFFPAWVFYFVVGLYAGAAYHRLRGELQKRIAILVPALALSGATVLSLHFSGVLHDVSSRRADVLLYTPFAVATLLAVAARLRSVPPLARLISRYAFGIYMLHPLCLEILWHATVSVTILVAPLMLVTLWVAGTAAALITTRLLAQLPLGSLFVGRIRSVSAGTALRQPAAMTDAPAVMPR